MPFNEANPIPISYNAMSDAQLRDFVTDPKDFLEPMKDHYIRPSLMHPNTKDRILSILQEQNNDPAIVKKKFDTLALIKVTKVIIEI